MRREKRPTRPIISAGLPGSSEAPAASAASATSWCRRVDRRSRRCTSLLGSRGRTRRSRRRLERGAEGDWDRAGEPGLVVPDVVPAGADLPAEREARLVEQHADAFERGRERLHRVDAVAELDARDARAADAERALPVRAVGARSRRAERHAHDVAADLLGQQPLREDGPMRRMSAPAHVGFAFCALIARQVVRPTAASASLFCGRSISSASAALGVRTPSITACICAVIGSSTPWRAPRSSAAWAVRRPSATMRLSAQDVVERAAAAELDADLAVAAAMAGAGQHEIAEPAEAGQRVGAAAHRGGQPRDLDQAAGDQRGHRVVAEAEALDDAGGDGDDVLERAADLDAGDVVGGVEPQRRPAELLLDEARGVGATSTRPRRRSADPPRPRRRRSAPTAPPPAAPDRPRRQSPATSGRACRARAPWRR